MTSFEFYFIFLEFVGGWDMKFKFFRFFLNFLTSNDKMIKFLFKRSNLYSNNHI
jgi:hypothetical protein